MGFSHVVTAGIVIIPLMLIAMNIPNISNTIMEINEAALDVSELEDTILNTHFKITNFTATGDSNLIYLDVYNTGNTKLWDYDNFDLIVTYEGVVGASATNVTERLSYTQTAPTGDPIEFDAATGFSGTCLILFGCDFDHTVTSSGSNRILIVGINTANNAAISGVTYDGAALTQIRQDDNGASAHTSLWYLVDPSTGTNNVHVSLFLLTDVTAGAVSFTGVDQIDPVDADDGATGTSATPTVNLTTTTDESWIIDVVGTPDGPLTAGDGQIERWQELAGTTSGAESTEFTSSNGTFSMSWTNSAGSRNWAISAAALKPAGTPCCVTIGDWNIESISNDSIDPDIINNNETASIRGKTSYQIVNNEGVHVTFSTDTGATASSFVDAS
jgi:archaellum component FlaF (FlaF/FlaG flagellin family)